MNNGADDSLHGKSKSRSAKVWNWIIFCAVCLMVCAGWLLIPFYVTQSFQVTELTENQVEQDSGRMENKEVAKVLKALAKKVNELEDKWDSYVPKFPYIVINTTTNQFHLYNEKGALIRTGFCSSGSYTKLILNDKKSWVFKTPKGRLPIISKTKNPVWAKPDWAFIEEGLPIPKSGDPSRFEAGVLGDYALRLPDGYMIHGTLYKRFLGMPVTHGCVRMGDEDLEMVFKTLGTNSYVYIY